jgi:hypothetical protein
VCCANGNLLPEALVRALHVEVSDVLGEQVLEVAFAKDQKMVEALATLTAAVLDRLAMHAIHIDIDGPSFRQHVGEESAKKRAADRGAKRKTGAGTEPRT